MTTSERRTSLDVNDRRKFLMLGFYDRGNLGDEAFKTMFPLYFRYLGIFDVECVFASTDDVDVIPKDVAAVVMAGGDTITPYFMEKVKRLLWKYTGPFYGISVGLPYDDDVKYLKMFDHVFVRSQYDAKIASDEIGARNVTYMPDVTLTWQTTKAFAMSNPFVHMPSQRPGLRTEIGVCLASPLLRFKPTVFRGVVEALTSVLISRPQCRLHFFAFNTNMRSVKECDVIVMKQVHDEIACNPLHPQEFKNRMVLHDHDALPLDADRMINKLSTMDMVVCMRYHSVMFSYMANTPFVTLSETKKIRTLLDDINYDKKCIVDASKYPEDSTSTLAIDLMKAIRHVLDTRKGMMAHVQTPLAFTPLLLQRARSVLAEDAPFRTRYRIVKFVPQPTVSLDAVIQRACLNLGSFLESSINDTVLDSVQPLDIKQMDPLIMSRIICHAVTGNVDNRCLWGLKENMTKPHFNLRDAIQYIFQDHNSTTNKELVGMMANKYYLQMPVKRRVFADIDPFACHTNSSVHRSGWSYVVNHMMNLNAREFERKPDLIIDTFADQTFHWAKESMEIAGNIPITKPWIGFLHHTFDTTHSEYNLVALFNDPVFLKSLETCRCLIALSEYLASQIRNALFSLGPTCLDVKVKSLVHPTMFVSQKFTFEKFMRNPDKKIVQIGAWLRNPYSIYALPLPSATDERYNPLKLRKCALKGKQMQNYFMPPDFFVNFYKQCKDMEGMGGVCGPSEDTLCRAYFDNKYINGMYHKLLSDHNSVEVINTLSNDGFDELLTENIVFLDLVDASAVNTVIECIVRNTVLIVNRHPAVEELLGKDYPGFFDSLFEAAIIVGKEDTLKSIHEHMSHNVDKKQLGISHFMERLQDVIEETAR